MRCNDFWDPTTQLQGVLFERREVEWEGLKPVLSAKGGCPATESQLQSSLKHAPSIGLDRTKSSFKRYHYLLFIG